MTDKITITIKRDILEHTVVALEYAYNSNDEMVMESIRFLRAALAQQAEPPSCKYCDGTGDVHSLDGQWRGRCTECNFSEPQTQKDKEQYAFEDWLASECPSGNVESVQSQWEASAEYLELQPGATEQALQKIADFGQDQERPTPSQDKSLALLDLDSVELMQGGANGPTIRLRGFINAQTGPTAPQPPIDNAFVAEGCEQFSTPTEPAEPVAWIGLPGKGTPLYAAQPALPLPPGYALVPMEPTPEMVAAYLAANTEYWRLVDGFPPKIGCWRNGTPSQATAESYRAMIAAAKKATP